MYIYLLLFVFGACIGSCITAVSYRMPIRQDLVFKRSFCPKCNAQLRIRSLIPIFSWIIQGGKCLSCGSKISFRYPLIELLSVINFVLPYRFLGNNLLLTVFVICLLELILLMSIIDLENYQIPLSTQMVFFSMSIIYATFFKHNFVHSIKSGLMYLTIFYLISKIVSLYKKQQAIGFADLTLVLSIGIFLAIKYLHIFLILTGIIGTVFGSLWLRLNKNKLNIFPFGPVILITFLCIFIINLNIVK